MASKHNIRADRGFHGDLYTRLIIEAPLIPGVDETVVVDNIEDIPWLDPVLIREGIHFLNRNFAMAVIADTFALMFGFCVKPMSAVVLRTGKLFDPEKSFKRYLSTVQRIARFSLLPVDQTVSSEAFRVVRNLHNTFRELSPVPMDLTFEPWTVEFVAAMQKDLEHLGCPDPPTKLLSWDPEVPLSQFDMAVTQFGFIAILWVHPERFGIQNRERELRGIVHLWAVIGRQLGLRDEYNVCREFDPAVFQKLHDNVLLESLKTMDETVVTIQSQFMKAFTLRVPFMTYRSMMFFGLQAIKGYEGENLWKLMSFRDKICYKFLQIWSWSMVNSKVYNFIANLQIGLWLQWQLWRNKLPTLLQLGIKNIWKLLRM